MTYGHFESTTLICGASTHQEFKGQWLKVYGFHGSMVNGVLLSGLESDSCCWTTEREKKKLLRELSREEFYGGDGRL